MPIQNSSKAGFYVEAYVEEVWRSYPLDRQTPPWPIRKLKHARQQAQQAARQNRVRTRVVSADQGSVMAEFDANGALIVSPTRQDRIWRRRQHYRGGGRR